jgi:hypothetical protein
MGAGLLSCGEPRATPLRYDPARAVHNDFSGARAFEWAEKIVAMGPRPSGSAALESTRRFFESELAALGWETRRQEFEDRTPRGKGVFVNLRARFPGGDTWARPLSLVVASHYDTKAFGDIAFVGANDGASGNAVMLELARITARRPDVAQQIELVFFDGEEALVSYSQIDGLHGSRHYQKFIRSLATSSRPKMAIVLDMVGDRHLNIEIPSNTSRRMFGLTLKAAAEAGTRDFFGHNPNEILDDHVPLAAAGLEVTNFIDFDFPAWHTAADTMDKLAPESLEITGRTTALLIEKFLLGGG